MNRQRYPSSVTLSMTLISALMIGLQADAENSRSNRLTTEEIQRVFSGARDGAIVRDAADTRAVNFWCNNGVLTTRWSNGDRSGGVVGRWRAVNGQRCVTIVSGLRASEGTERCSPIVRSGEAYLSFNPDGSIHGVHSLFAMTPAEARENCKAAPGHATAP